MPAPARSPARSLRRDEQPTHAEIVERIGIRQDDAERQADLMAMTMQRIEKAVTEGMAVVHQEMAAIRESIGSEGHDEYGKPIGTGVVGRLMRMEGRVGRYDGWVKWATGALFTAAFFGGVLWWAWEAKLKAVLL